MQQLPYIDWDQAAKVGGQLAHPGPELTPGQIAQVVDALRSAAAKAPAHITEVSGMATPAPADTLVVDRAGWLAAMAASARAIMTGLGAPQAPEGGLDKVRGRTLGLQAGGLFAALSSRILGQFDPFGQPNRLLLVAPNVVAIERRLGVNPTDFRLWVCLHEQTHQYQFGQAPWLREHLLGLMAELLNDTEPLRQWRAGERPRSIAEAVIAPAQRESFDQVTAIMSLLEGHADVMMDRVGTAVLPTLPVIRRAFEHHRDRGGWSAILSKLLGADLKRAQYRDGAKFCQLVLKRADTDLLNLAFSQPAMLPSLAEIHDPEQWLHRVGQ
ncbi:MAG: zinc-dependent metalloprotease [Actinobacteria bacterium]|nr:zinc-dependent metalloprotease [Actinomycetota bacterium]